jgi:hypothetical protein
MLYRTQETDFDVAFSPLGLALGHALDPRLDHPRRADDAYHLPSPSSRVNERQGRPLGKGSPLPTPLPRPLVALVHAQGPARQAR